MLLTEIIKAMQAGKEITNPASWKNAQTTTNALVAIGGMGITLMRMKGVDLHISDSDLMTLAGAVATILGVINGIITTISSKKVGL